MTPVLEARAAREDLRDWRREGAGFSRRRYLDRARFDVRPALSSRFVAEPPVLLSLATSVDGFIADEAGGIGWLNPYFSSEMDFAGFMASVGVSVIGRTTYDEGRAAGGPSFGRCVILTHRPLVGAPEGVEAWGGDLAELVARLKGESTGVIWLMGGGRAAHSFLEAGLVDELSLNIIPVLLGAGRPLFLPRSSSDRLELLETRRYDNGCVSLRYRFADRP